MLTHRLGLLIFSLSERQTTAIIYQSAHDYSCTKVTEQILVLRILINTTTLSVHLFCFDSLILHDLHLARTNQFCGFFQNAKSSKNYKPHKILKSQ